MSCINCNCSNDRHLNITYGELKEVLSKTSLTTDEFMGRLANIKTEKYKNNKMMDNG